MLDDDTGSEKNTSPLDPKAEERHTESAALVGHYVEVDYPSRGVLKGLVTGYYRETTFFRIDFLPHADLPSDNGVVVERRLFHSEEDECICTISITDPIRDSSMALKYFDASLTNFPRRSGRVGYMMGKIVKSDWGDDGVFLGIIVNYQKGQKFQIKYMDGDDEWGTFVKEFTAFDLEDGGQRKIAWFDLRRDGLKAAGKEPSARQRRGPSREKPTVASEDREIKEATSSMLDDIIHNVLKPQKPKDAFISAFRQEFKTEHNGTPEQPKRAEPKELARKKPVRKTGPKRALELTNECDSQKKLQKTDSQFRPKRQRGHVNGTIESSSQPATKKLKNKAKKEEKMAALIDTQPLWLSEQTTVITSPPKKPAANASDDPQVDSVEERTTAVIPPPSSDPRPCDVQETKALQRETPQSATKDTLPAGWWASPHSTTAPERKRSLSRSSPVHSSNAAVAAPQASVKESAGAAAISQRPSRLEKSRISCSANSMAVTSPAITSPSVRRPARYSSIEIGLEMQTFEKHLENLTVSRDRIAKATNVATSLAHCGGAKHAIDAVMIQMKEPVGAERKITLFYLLDSILQCSHKDRARAPLGKSTGETIVFLELVESHLKEIVETLSEEYDSYTKLEKVLELWKEWHIFSAESMDRALTWLHERSGKHERFLEDDRLRSEKRIPYYIRSPDGPQCHRVILSSVFASVGSIPECLNVPSTVSGRKLEKYAKSAWDEIDKAIEDEAKTAYRRGRRVTQMAHEEALSDEQPEEGEIPAQPPLPSDSPPADVDDPNFVAPLPSDDEDPNFIPPLPTSPPPAHPPQPFRHGLSHSSYRGRDFGGGFLSDRSLPYRDRADRFEGHSDHLRGRNLDSRRPPSRRSSQERELEKNWYRGGRYRQEDFCPEMYPRHLQYPLHPRPMQHLPHPLGAANFPYPPPGWSHARPPHHPESYPMWNPHRRHW